MQLTWAALFWLTQQCAPAVHWETMTAVVVVESAAYTLAIHDNKTRKAHRPSSLEEAVRIAEDLISRGHSVDLGLAQVNSMHLGPRGASVRDMFEPCKNLRLASTLLHEKYQRALKAGYAWGQPALQASLSAYNTGSFTRGGHYVQRVLFAARSPYTLQPFLST